MLDVKDRWHSVTDRDAWVARGASFVAKAKATKAVWFPPKPVSGGAQAASDATKATKRTARKTTGTTKKTASRAKTAKKPSKKAAAKKTTAGSGS